MCSGLTWKLDDRRAQPDRVRAAHRPPRTAGLRREAERLLRLAPGPRSAGAPRRRQYSQPSRPAVGARALAGTSATQQGAAQGLDPRTEIAASVDHGGEIRPARRHRGRGGRRAQRHSRQPGFVAALPHPASAARARPPSRPIPYARGPAHGAADLQAAVNVAFGRALGRTPVRIRCASQSFCPPRERRFRPGDRRRL